jgi:hypothetical protein
MTAPLAWLYAIPYERFQSPADAVQANLLTLGLVALWRVVLMIRVVSVLGGYGPLAAGFLVMAFADAVALVAIFLLPMPVIDVMGGLRHTDSESVILGVSILVKLSGILSAPVWAIGALTVWIRWDPDWRVPTDQPRRQTARGMWALAVASVVIWFLVLPWTQREQRLRTKAELGLKAGRIAEALEFMSAHEQSDFPPQWDVPPRVGYGEKRPHILDVMEEILARPPAPWVRTVYLEKFRQFMGEPNSYYDAPKRGDEAARIARILLQLPEGPDLAAEYKGVVTVMLEHNPGLPAEDRKNLQAIVDLAEKAARK